MNKEPKTQIPEPKLDFDINEWVKTVTVLMLDLISAIPPSRMKASYKLDMITILTTSVWTEEDAGKLLEMITVFNESSKDSELN